LKKSELNEVILIMVKLSNNYDLKLVFLMTIIVIIDHYNYEIKFFEFFEFFGQDVKVE